MIYYSRKRSIVSKTSKTIYSDGSVETTTFTNKVKNPYHRKRVCRRCGRNSHEETSCYARRHLTGHLLITYEETSCCDRRHLTGHILFTQDQDEQVQPDYEFSEAGQGEFIRSGIYVLSLNDGKYHVGQSENIDSTIDRYLAGCGSEWTIQHGVVREIVPVTRQITTQDEWEKNEVMELAKRYGLSNVRGYKWDNLYLDPWEMEDMEISICESKKLCQNCGESGHRTETCISERRSMWMRI